MASSSFPAGAAVKFWVPNLGARAPVDLTTGLPDYSEYVRSGLWVQRRRLRVCDGTGLTAYMPEGDRSWPDTYPVSNMKIHQTYCHMGGRDTGESSEPAQRLGNSGGAGGAGSPHHGLRRGQSSSPHSDPETEMESHLFGLFLGGCEPKPAHNYETVRR